MTTGEQLFLASTLQVAAGAKTRRILTHGAGVRYVADSIQLHDVFTGLLKSLVFAVIIVNVGCLEGFRTRGGPDAVGRSATSAVVWSTFLVILADVFFTAIFYLVHKGA